MSFPGRLVFLSVSLFLVVVSCGKNDSAEPGPGPKTGQPETLVSRLLFTSTLVEELGRDGGFSLDANCLELVVPRGQAAYVTVGDASSPASLRWGAREESSHDAAAQPTARSWEIVAGEQAIGRVDEKIFRRTDGTSYAAYVLEELCTGSYACHLNIVKGKIQGLK